MTAGPWRPVPLRSVPDQEALTDVVRHSGSRHARVRIGRDDGGGDDGAIRPRTDDDGPVTGAGAGGSGNGPAGMRERAAALGGTIEAGPRAEGGRRVTAVLPVRRPGNGTRSTARTPGERAGGGRGKEDGR